MEKEVKIEELEKLAQEAEMRAKTMQRERELRAQEARLRDWEQQLERRGREAQKRLEEAQRILRGDEEAGAMKADTKSALGNKTECVFICRFMH